MGCWKTEKSNRIEIEMIKMVLKSKFQDRREYYE